MNLISEPFRYRVETIFIMLSTSLLSGLVTPAVRGSYSEGANVILIILLTTIVRAISLSVYCFVIGEKFFINRVEFINSSLGGFIQALSIVGIMWAMFYLPGPVAVTIVFLHSLLLLFFLCFKGEIIVNKWIVAVTLLCLIGIAFVVDIFSVSPVAEGIGYILAFMAALTTAWRLYIFGKLTQLKNPAVVGAETFIWASVFLIPLMFYQTPLLPNTTMGYVWVALSVVASSLASIMMFFAIGRLGGFYYSLYNKLEPVFAAIFSVLLIGEVLSFSQYMGIFIVIASLVSYQIWSVREIRDK